MAEQTDSASDPLGDLIRRSLPAWADVGSAPTPGSASGLAPGFARSSTGELFRNGKPADTTLPGGIGGWQEGPVQPSDFGSDLIANQKLPMQPAMRRVVQPSAGEGFDMNRFVERNMQLEGEGKDPLSPAVGGFMPKTWIGQVRKNVPGASGMSDEQILALRSDPGLRRQMWASLARDNAAALQAGGASPTADNLRLANWFGAGGALKILGASDETPISSLFPPVVEQQNPILKGKTVGDIKQMVARQMAGGGSGTSAVDPTGKITSQIEKVREAYGREATNLDAVAKSIIKEIGSSRGDLNEAMARVRLAQDKADEAQRAALKAIGNAPAQPDIDGFKHMGGLATLVGIFGGMFTRTPMLSSLNAAAAAIEAYNDHDREKYKIAYNNWKTQTDMLFKIADMTQGRVRDIMYNEQMGMNERRALLDATLRAAGLSQLADAARANGEGVVLQWMENMQAADLAHRDRMAQIESNEKLRMMMLELPKNEAQMMDQYVKEKSQQIYKETGQYPDADQRMELAKHYRETVGVGAGGFGPSKTIAFVNDKGDVTSTLTAREKKGSPGWYDDNGNRIEAPQGERIMLTKTEAGGLTDEGAELTARRILAGDQSATVGMARSTANMTKVNNTLARLTMEEADKLGLPHEKAGELLAIRAAEFKGLIAGEQTAGQVGSRIGMANAEARLMLPILLGASEKVNRTEFPTLNSVINAFNAGTGGTEIKEFGQAINSFINVYARATGGGNTAITDAQRERGLKMLGDNFTKDQIKGVVDIMWREMQAGKASPGLLKEEMRHTFMGQPQPGEPAPGAAGASPTALPPPAVGTVRDGYRFKGGDPSKSENWEPER